MEFIQLWNYDDNEFVVVYEYGICIWRNSMDLMGRFYGDISIVYVLM